MGLQKFKEASFLPLQNKVVTVDDTPIKLQIWDTAGQERFRSVTHAYYRDAHALLLLYDVTNKTSYDNIRAWLSEIREHANEDVVIMLLGESRLYLWFPYQYDRSANLGFSRLKRSVREAEYQK